MRTRNLSGRKKRIFQLLVKILSELTELVVANFAEIQFEAPPNNQLLMETQTIEFAQPLSWQA